MPSKISKNSVVTFHYTLHDSDGTKIESSKGKDPLSYLHGHSQIVAGLERELSGKAVGDKLKVSVDAANGYGEHNKGLIMEVPRDKFPKAAKLEVGAIFKIGPDAKNSSVVQVTAVSDKSVTLDGNHPLAGVDLVFDVEIVGIRAATKEELEHGHAHGAGGHKH